MKKFHAIEYFPHALLFLLLIISIFITVFFPIQQIEGNSMEPTLMENQHIIIWRFYYTILWKKPSLNDIIVFRDSSGSLLIKRVCGVPGDKINYNDNRLKEYSHIPDGYYLVLGDNKEYSRDSRHIGLISISQIEGKVIFWNHNEKNRD